MIHSDHEPHPEAVEILFVCPNEDKNETSENLYGPGRTVGKAFDFGGRHVDAFLSKTAERMGHGPRVTAQRIRRRREVIEHAFVHYERVSCWRCDENPEEFLRSPASINAQAEKVEKDIKRLLKYVNSNVQSTQRLAINQIVDLTRHDDIRSLLKGMGATKIISDSIEIYSKFHFGDFDDLLLSSSRKALVSLRDTEINTLLQQWTTVVYSRGLWDDPEENYKPLWNRIALYLDDPDTAFLVMRAVRRSDVVPPRSLTLKYVHSSLRNSAKYFEWEECEAAFHDMIQYNYGLPDRFRSSGCEWVLQYADKMPGIFKSKWFQQLSMNVNELGPYRFIEVHRLKNAFVLAVTSAGEDGHIPSLDVLKSMYPYPVLKALLDSLVCPLEHVLRSFVSEHEVFYDYTPGAAESHVYNEIARYIDSSDLTLRAKAWNYVNFFLALDIHRCDMMLEALSLTNFATMDNFSNFKKTKREQCVPKEGGRRCVLYRHLIRTNNQIHHHDRYAQSCSCNIVNAEEMIYYADWDLKMRVERGTTFSSVGLYPAVTEYDADGSCVYVAKIWFQDPDCTECDCITRLLNSMFSIVREGTKPEDLRLEVTCHHRKSLQIPERFDVLVLRYAPEAYPKALGADGETTGPFSWRPAREHEAYHMRYTARVITADEAVGAPDEDRCSSSNEGKVESNVELDEHGLHSCDEQVGAEASSQSDSATFLSCEGDRDEAASELEMSESISQLSDGIRRPETDEHLESCDGGMETNLVSGSDEVEGEPELDLMDNALEDSSCEENEDESNSPQSDEVESLPCKRADQRKCDVKSGELDSLSGEEIDRPGTGGSNDVQLPTCDAGMEAGLASEPDGPTVDETVGHVIVSEAHRDSTSRMAAPYFIQWANRFLGVEIVDDFNFRIPDLPSAILYAVIFSLGFILRPYIS